MAKRKNDDGEEAGRKIDTSQYTAAEFAEMQVEAMRKVKSAVQDIKKAEEELTKIKEEELEQEKELLRLKEISASRDKLEADQRKKREGFNKGASRAAQAFLTTQIKSLAKLDTEEAMTQRLAALEIQRNNLMQGAGGTDTRYNAEKAQAIGLVIEQLQLMKDLAKINEHVTGSAEEQTQGLQNLADRKRLIVNLSEAELDLIRDQQIAIDIVGARADALVESITGGIKGFGEVFGKIPIIGGVLQTTLEKLNESFSKKLTKAATDFKDKFAENIKSGQGVMQALKNSVGTLGAGIRAALAASGPLLFLAALAIGVKKADEMEQAAIDMRKAMGGNVEEGKKMANQMKDVAKATKSLGADMEDAKKAFTALRNELPGIEPISNAAAISVITMSKAFDVTEEHAAKAMAAFENIGGLSQEGAAGAMMLAANMANAAGVPVGAVLEDIATNSKELAIYIRGGAKEMISAAIHAKMMGVALDKVLATSKKILNFEQSITDELEASAILGVDINLQKAREAAFNGDLVGQQQAIMQELTKIGDVTKLNAYAKEALVEATGMELEDLSKMQRIQQRFPGIEKEKMAAAMALAGKYGDLNNVTEEMLQNETERLAKDEQMRTTLQQMQDAFAEIGNALAKVLIPLGKVFLAILSVTLLPALEGIATVFGWIADWVNAIGDAFGGWGDTLSPILSVLKIIGGLITGYYLVILAIKGAQLLWNAAVGGWNALKAISIGLMGAEKTAAIASAATGLTGTTAQLARLREMQALRRANPGMTMMDAFNKTKTPIPTATTAPTTAPTQSVAKSASAINPAMILSVAAAMIAFAVAIYILALAFQEFDKIKDGVGTMGMFAGAIIGMGAAIYLLTTLLAPLATTGILQLVALGMLAFGAAVMLVGLGIKYMSEGMATLITAFSAVGTQIIGPLTTLISMIGPIFLLAGAFAALGYSLATVALFGLAALPALAGIAAIGTGVAALVTAISPAKEETNIVSKEGEGGKQETLTETIQVMIQPLLEQIVGLRNDLNSGKVAVYLDGTKVMKELKVADSKNLVTNRPRI